MKVYCPSPSHTPQPTRWKTLCHLCGQPVFGPPGTIDAIPVETE